MGDVSVQEAVSRRDRARFHALPYALYADDPHWVPPLRRALRAQLDRARNPFWQHAAYALFIAQCNGRVAGRIMASVDYAYNAHWRESTGWFGLFECHNDVDVAGALFDAASSWVGARGMSMLRGPVNPTTMHGFGFLIDGFERDPVFMLPYNPPCYLDLAHTWGFRDARQLYSYQECVGDPVSPRLRAIAARAAANPRVSVRPYQWRAHADAAALARIYNACWAANYGYSPASEEEFYAVDDAMRHFGRVELSLLGCVDAKPVAAIIVVPDVNEVSKRLGGRLGPVNSLRFLWLRRRISGCRTLFVGCLPAYRALGLPALLYDRIQAFARHHYQTCAHAWVLEDNRAMNTMQRMIGSHLHTRYMVLEREVMT
jgi:hypothetical protein